MINEIENIYKEKIKSKKVIYKEDLFSHISLNQLSRENRVVIKVVYLLGNVLEEHLQKILYPIYGNHGYRKAIGKLITEGWIYKEKTKQGNMVAVTRQSMQCLFPNMQYVERIEIKEHRTIHYCSQGNIIAFFIIEKYAAFLKKAFNNLTKEEKRAYLKQQYIEQIAYKAFLEKTEEGQKQVLEEMQFTQEEVNYILDSKMKKINKKVIQAFAQKYDCLVDKGFKEFIKVYQQQLSTDKAVILLRDLKTISKKKFDVLEVLNDMNSNIILNNWNERFLENFVEQQIDIGVYKAMNNEMNLLQLNRIVCGIQRRQLQLLKQLVEDGEEVGENMDKIDELLNKKSVVDEYIEKIKNKRDEIYKSKILMIQEANGNFTYMTFERLKQNGIYITDFYKDKEEVYIKWSIVDGTEEGLRSKTLVNKIFLIKMFTNNLFKLDIKVHLMIELATCTEQRINTLQKEVVELEKRLKKFKTEFLDVEIKVKEISCKLEKKYDYWYHFRTLL